MAIEVTHWLNRTIGVFRRQPTPDGMGGQVVDWALVDSIPGRVSMPAGGAIPVMTDAQQTYSRSPYRVYMLPGSEVQRGDRLVDATTDRELVVEAVTQPSEQIYLRAECREYQQEDTP
jgi:hypothetical protein